MTSKPDVLGGGLAFHRHLNRIDTVLPKLAPERAKLRLPAGHRHRDTIAHGPVRAAIPHSHPA
jgi:hypothetical protein